MFYLSSKRNKKYQLCVYLITTSQAASAIQLINQKGEPNHDVKKNKNQKSKKIDLGCFPTEHKVHLVYEKVLTDDGQV